MSAVSTASALVTGLDGVTRERGLIEVDLEAALTEIGREEAASRRAIEEGHRRLAALRELRREYEERLAGLSNEMVHREWTAVRAGLADDRDRFMARVELVQLAVLDRVAQLDRELEEPELAGAVEEYLKFREAETSLAAMPPDYRDAIVTQHRRVLRRLEPYINAANAGPPPLDVPAVGIGVVASADPAEGVPEALVVVLPVPYSVYGDWNKREEDLASQIAFRLVAAVIQLLSSLGAADAPLRYVEVHGCLAIQVWLGDHEVEGDVRERALESISGAAEEAPELWAAGVELYAVWLKSELLTEEPS